MCKVYLICFALVKCAILYLLTCKQQICKSYYHNKNVLTNKNMIPTLIFLFVQFVLRILQKFEKSPVGKFLSNVLLILAMICQFLLSYKSFSLQNCFSISTKMNLTLRCFPILEGIFSGCFR